MSIPEPHWNTDPDHKSLNTLSRWVKFISISLFVLIIFSACAGFASAVNSGINGLKEIPISEATYTLPPNSGIRQGTWVVGKDINPGTYYSLGANLCYWERQSDATGEVIDNAHIRGPQTVTIHKTDYAFHTMGCAGWYLK